jgi:hypothetical protein
MAINKINLERDGLIVGDTQLVASGGGVYVGNNIAVGGGVYTKDLLVTGNASFSGNVTAVNFIGSGALLTGLPAGYSNVQVATYLPTYNGNITVNRVGYVWAANNVSSVYQVFNNSTNSLDTVFG